jgi:hypothetical protein
MFIVLILQYCIFLIKFRRRLCFHDLRYYFTLAWIMERSSPTDFLISLSRFWSRNVSVVSEMVHVYRRKQGATDRKVAASIKQNSNCWREDIVQMTLFFKSSKMYHQKINLVKTNLSDNPDQKKMICRHERISNLFKSTISIMICGSASEVVLELCVVYECAQLWTTWTEGGPLCCWCHHTVSKWFDVGKYVVTKTEKVAREKNHCYWYISYAYKYLCIPVVPLGKYPLCTLFPIVAHNLHTHMHVNVAWQQIFYMWKSNHEDLRNAVLYDSFVHYWKIPFKFLNPSLEMQHSLMFWIHKNCFFWFCQKILTKKIQHWWIITQSKIIKSRWISKTVEVPL